MSIYTSTYLFMYLLGQKIQHSIRYVIIHKEGDIETVPELYFVPWNL